MILRSITKHVSDQNWVAIAIDFFIVVLGVFIGIQVSNWNQGRVDRQDEIETLTALHSQLLRADQVSAGIIDSRNKYANLLATATNVLFGIVGERPLTPDECRALAVSHVLYVGRADLPALSQLESSGRLNIVRDRQLNSALTGLIQRREALDLAMELSNAQHDLSHLYPELFKLLSFLEESDARPDQERRAYAECNANSIRKNQSAMNAIAQNADGFDAYFRDGLRPWMIQFEQAHESLDAHLRIEH